MTAPPFEPCKLEMNITRVAWLMALAWTLISAGFLIFSVWSNTRIFQQGLIDIARTHFKHDLAFRKWGTLHGGVYVPITEKTPPNPYLTSIPERDIETPSGKKLTLLNPAYMVRQLFENFSAEYEANEHITSLQPLNPKNAPDAWEKKALTFFNEGQTEVIEFVNINSSRHLRLMQPLLIQEGCLKCHAHQGYKLGDVRGGISITLPAAPMEASKNKVNHSTMLGLGGLWLLGLGSLFWGHRSLVARAQERDRITEAWQNTYNRYADAQRIAHLGHWELNLQTNTLQWSEEVFHIFAKDKNTFTPTVDTFIEAIHPDDRERVMLTYTRSVQEKTAYYCEHRLLMPDGSLKHVREQGETFYAPTGSPLYSLGTALDITQHKNLELSLKKSEQRLELALKGAKLGLWDWNITTGEVIFNERWAEMLGYERDEIEPHVQSWEQLLHPDDAATVQETLAAHLNGRTPFYEVECRLRSRNGEWKWIYDIGRVVDRDPSGKALRAVGIHQDVTERHHLTEQIVQQERLAAVGQLAAGIAHDFNNTLTSILGFAQILHYSPEIPASAKDNLAVIISSSQRASHLVRQMLDFSRKSIRSPKQLDLVPFTKEVVKFLRSAIPESIDIRLEILPGDYLVHADPVQIQQMLTNLALNARDAMSATGGALKIVLSNNQITGKTFCVTCNYPISGNWITIEVSDTGTGLAPEHLPHIFEPFFTTKEVGKGSGLGLAQVHGIVKQHGGHVKVDSVPGQGATFTVFLPPLLTHTPSNTAEEAAPIYRGHGETILLVEDEVTVLKVMKATLQNLGYQVLTATNGKEALQVYTQHKENISLILSDMVMPDMDGAALFTTMREKDPAVRVLLMSGYPLTEQGAALLEQGVVDWFQKPPTQQTLSKTLYKALGGIISP